MLIFSVFQQLHWDFRHCEKCSIVLNNKTLLENGENKGIDGSGAAFCCVKIVVSWMS